MTPQSIDYHSLTTSDSIGRANSNPFAPAERSPRPRRWLRTVLAAALLALPASHLKAQTASPFIEAPGSPFPVGNTPDFVVAADFNGDGKVDLAVANTYSSTGTVLLGDGKGGFPAVSGFYAGSGAYLRSLAVGDFNRDGKLDIVVAKDDGLRLLLGDGKGGFSLSPYSIPGLTSVGSAFVVAGDFNGDGKLDLAATGPFPSGDSVSVLLGDGTGRFTEASILTGYFPYPLSVSDFNSDGKPDLLAVDQSGNVKVLLGDGTGKFTATTSVLGGQFTVVGDFNGDGRADIAVAGSGNVSVMLGDGTGKFTAAPGSPYFTGVDASSLAAGDFDGDGKPDLALTNSAGNSITVLVGDGAGRLVAAPGSPFPTGTNPASVAVADFNGDGRPDLAVANSVAAGVPGSVTVLLLNRLAALTANPRSVTFYAGAWWGAKPAAIPVAISSAISGVTYTATSNQTWLKLRPTSGVTGGASSVALSADPASVGQVAGTYSAVVRFEAPGFFGSSTNVTFKVTNPSGTLKAASSPLVGSNPAAVAVGDFNRDGKLDLAVANWYSNNVTVLLGDGAGGFTLSSSPAVGTNPVSVAVGDFNRDGKLDLAVANFGSGDVTVLLGDGTGKFTALPSAPFPILYVGCTPYSVVTADFNLDGKLDLLVQPNADNPPRFTRAPLLLLGDGTGRFSGGLFPTGFGPCTVPDTPLPASLAVGDFNGDGIPDFVTVGADGNNFTVMLGNGDGEFGAAPGSPFASGERPGFVVVEDFNGDGKQDLAVGDAVGGVALLLGDGTGKFTAAPTSPFLRYFPIRALSVGDFNGDGKPDLAVADAVNGVTVLLGNGHGNFKTPTGTGWFAAGAANLYLPLFMAMGDFNGDGKPDLAVPDNAGDNVSVLLGEAAITKSVLSTAASTTIPYGTTVPLTLNVSDAVTAFAVPTGSVSFYDGATLLGSLFQWSGSPCTFNAVNLAPGIHTLSAKYAGDPRSVGATSNTITIQVQ